MGLSFDTRYRLDAAQSRHDRKLRAAGKELSPARLRAEEKRQERAIRDSARLQSTVLPHGNKAYRVSLLLAAVIYGIKLEVKFPDAAPSEDLRIRARAARSPAKTVGERHDRSDLQIASANAHSHAITPDLVAAL